MYRLKIENGNDRCFYNIDYFKPIIITKTILEKSLLNLIF